VTVQGEYPSHGAQLYLETMKKRLAGGRKCRWDDCMKIYVHVNTTGLGGVHLFYLS
jgi:hypothetical protein